MRIVVFFVAMLMIQGHRILAQEKTFVKEYTYKAGEMDSKISCRAIATNQLRTELLNEIGVYVESEQLLKTVEVGGKFSQDFVENIATISAGVTKLEVLEEHWNGEIFWMKAAITVDRKSLEESLKQLVSDKQKVKEFEELKLQLTHATKELDRLKKEMETKGIKSDPKAESLNTQKYNNEINTLIASDYFLKAKEKLLNFNYEGAKADYTKAIEFNPQDANTYFSRGYVKEDLLDKKGAMIDYTKAIELNPQHHDAYRRRGLLKIWARDDIGAMADFTKAIELNPEDELSYAHRGLIKEYQDDIGAISDYTKAININEARMQRKEVSVFFTQLANYRSYNGRGSSKLRLLDYRGAVVDFTKSIELLQENYDAYNGRGYSKMNLLDYKGATADFTKAIELDPNLGDAYYGRGISKISLQQKESGCIDLSKAGELGDERAYEAIRDRCN